MTLDDLIEQTEEGEKGVIDKLPWLAERIEQDIEEKFEHHELNIEDYPFLQEYWDFDKQTFITTPDSDTLLLYLYDFYGGLTEFIKEKDLEEKVMRDLSKITAGKNYFLNRMKRGAFELDLETKAILETIYGIFVYDDDPYDALKKYIRRSIPRVVFEDFLYDKLDENPEDERKLGFQELLDLLETLR